MNNKTIIFIVIFIAGLFFIGFIMIQPKTTQISEQETTDFATLTSSQLAEMLLKKDFLFVNVHMPYAGEIENTDAFIPYDKLADNLAQLPKDKNAKIVLYCRSGRMSELAARELAQLGYTQVSHLSGGMIDWQKNGYEIIKK